MEGDGDDDGGRGRYHHHDSVQLLQSIRVPLFLKQPIHTQLVHGYVIYAKKDMKQEIRSLLRRSVNPFGGGGSS
ncbi:hypothetical protein L1987_37336 [Smallanthus sonchifolius]|uniref:Uncharacterized protein n=1 Tax=Smallanthus sonchifolius TaxID=185202 RepID=A0ACB9HHC0_9ASTR|nr:hypothetical protein L1987_37336 [Smallanthus sonchifolius]